MKGYIERITGTIPYTNKTVDIPLNGKNLIITGSNGSGKTSLLRSMYLLICHYILDKKSSDLEKLNIELRQYELELLGAERGNFLFLNDRKQQIKDTKILIESIQNKLQANIPQAEQLFEKIKNNKGAMLYFEDRRLTEITEAKTPLGLHEEISGYMSFNHDTKVGKKLEQHLLNLKTRRSLAITEDKDHELAEKIGKWMTEFENNLKYLFEDNSVQLHFNSNNNKFSISQNNKPPFTFQTLSSGYSAIFDIYADILMRAEYYNISPHALEGVVFIDEIDSHLHISLQRLILPFFIEAFPNIQFIIATHSPFVLTSTQDTLIFDLAKDEPYQISQLKSQSEILSDFLGVPTAMPVWAEKSLSEILNKYLSKEPDAISLAALKEELINAGLEAYFPDSAAKILESKQ